MYYSQNYKNSSVNDVTGRNVYGTFPGATLGMRASAMTPSSVDDGGPAPDAPPANSAAAPGGFIGRPFTWWFLLVAMLVGLMFAGRKLGDAEEFRNVKVSAFNVLVVSVMAIIGIVFLKVVFNRFKVPGLSDMVLAV